MAKSKHGHGAPGKEAQSYRIRNARGTDKPPAKKPGKRATPKHSAAQMHTGSTAESKCIQCLRPRHPRTFPICEDCQDKNAKKRKDSIHYG
jgi:hypothetical protein